MYQVQMTCACGEKYWPTQKWIHEKCGVVNTTTASNTASNKESTSNNASNTWRVVEAGKGVDQSGLESRCGEGDDSGDAVRDSGPVGKRGAKQRWGRDAYNAYQREYMRKKRK
jgi:hypothetical protein